MQGRRESGWRHLLRKKHVITLTSLLAVFGVALDAQAGRQAFNADGNFTVPAGVRQVTFSFARPRDMAISLWFLARFWFAVALFSFGFVQGAFADMTAITLPTTSANVDNSFNQAWSNVANIENITTTSVANSDRLRGQSTDYLRASGYGFSIPASASIDGIEVFIWRYDPTGNGVSDDEVRLMDAGTPVGNNYAVAGGYPTTGSGAEQSYGGASDLWSYTWTPAKINNAGFGVSYVAYGGGNRVDAYVGYITVRVHYTVPGPTVTADTSVTSAATATHVDSPFTISATFDDNGSSVSSCDWTVDGGSNWNSFTPVDQGGGSWLCEVTSATCTEADNPLSINIRGTNADGSDTGTALVRDCDTTKPATTDDTDAAWSTTEITVTLSPVDTGSGVTAASGILGCIGDSCSTALLGGNSMTSNCGAGNECSEAISYYAVDNVSNQESVHTLASRVRVDRKPPVTTASPTFGTYVANQTITLSPTDGGSGVASTDYCVGAADVGTDCVLDQTGTSFAVNGVANESHVYRVCYRSTDVVGNVETPTVCGDYTIDLVPKDDTTPGTVMAEGQHNSIVLTSPYTGDADNDNDLRIEWEVCPGAVCDGATFTNVSSPDPIGHQVSPYKYTIVGLTNGTTYQVKVTFLESGGDVVNPTNPQVITDVVAKNNLLHNSLTTGSAKHGGNWGTATGLYGEFACDTCHERNSGNIKRVKLNISYPDGSAMPGGGTSAAVSYLSAVDGSSDFGDDSAAPRASSNRVCEVCHTYDAAQAVGTNVHAANQQVTTGHYDKADCIKCHPHSVGFKASCDSCHASPPVDSGTDLVKDGSTPADATGSNTAGKHAKHAVDLGYACTTCHTGWEAAGEMPNGGEINIGFDVFGSNAGSYDGRSPVGNYNANAPITVTAGATFDCTVYCHGSTIGGVSATALWNDAATISCGDCHKGTASQMDDAAAFGSHQRHAGDGAGALQLTCDQCHGSTPSLGDGHLDGEVVWNVTALKGNSPTYASAASGSAGPAPTTYESCGNVYCHSNVQSSNGTAAADLYATPTWGGTVACGDCHGDSTGRPSSGSHAKHPFACSACHNGSGDETVNHADYVVQVAIDTASWGAPAAYGQPAAAPGSGGYGTCTNVSCHGGTETPAWGVSGTLTCADCHTITAHTTDSRNGSADCNHCHADQHDTSGSDTANAVLIANNSTVGIDYFSGGIHLKKTIQSITKATEAEICWACHLNQSTPISEWEDNNNATTGSIPYDYGSLSNSAASSGGWYSVVTLGSEAGATWTSANFGYKTSNIQSTHSANSDGTNNGLDAVADIRCSYCHDVHNTATGLTGDVSGQPYLRGSWLGNPYREDGAPQSGVTYTDYGTDNFGRVPRGSNNSGQQMGGYWIDQNSGDPINKGGTGSLTYDDFGGICQLCHGTDVNALNIPGSGLGWVSAYNGHANAVQGGAGAGSGAEAAARNIFDARGGNTSDYRGRMAYLGNGDPGNGSAGIRSTDSDALRISPYVNGAGSWPRANEGPFNWDELRSLDVTGSTTDSNYHTFSCSKCHNPHASRLPKLMITNCLDTKHNQWDNGIQIGGTDTSFALLNNVTAAAWSTAQNCHRLVANDPLDANDQNQNAEGAGWNLVTPWTDTDGYGTGSAPVQDNSGSW